jgi:phospholipase/carboxylesterase
MRRFLLVSFFFTVLSCSPEQQLAPLQYLVSEPEVINSSTPVLIMLHGYGSNEADLFSLAKKFAPDYLVLSLRGPLSTGNGGYCWFHLDFLPAQKFHYDYKAAVDAGKLVTQTIESICKKYRPDTSSIYLLGFSQGAIISYDIALRNPRLISGVLALSGAIMQETRSLSIDHKTHSGLKMFVGHGIYDDVVRFSDGKDASDFLRSKGIRDVSFHEYPIGHALGDQEIAVIRSWLAKQL